MRSNTKSLIIECFIIIISGFSMLMYGWSRPLEIQSKVEITSVIEEPKISTSSAAQGVAGERVEVSKVVDGDTIVISAEGGGNTTVRFIGIDTPETVDPRRPVGCYGKEASDEVKKILTGKSVILQKDVSDKDKYNRILRYIYLPLDPSTSSGQVLFVNDYLVREGFAKVLTYPPDIKFDNQFREAETQAKANMRGLWGKCRN